MHANSAIDVYEQDLAAQIRAQCPDAAHLIAAYMRVANERQRLREFDAAATAYQRAAELASARDPRDPVMCTAYTELATMRFAQGKLDRDEACVPFLLMFRIRAMQGRADDAIECCDRAHDMLPRFSLDLRMTRMFWVAQRMRRLRERERTHPRD